MELKRYAPVITGAAFTSGFATMLFREDGDWVRFADVEPVLAHMDEQVRTLTAQNAALQAGASAQQAIYQHEFAPGEWRDVSQDEYNRTGAKFRRVVYAAPSASKEDH